MDLGKFFARVRGEFGPLTQLQVDGFNRYIAATNGMDITWIAYILATVWHETGTSMYPVRETKSKSDSAAIRILDKAFKDGKLPWVKTPYWSIGADGKSWLGRGDIQVTHKENYLKSSKYAGVDLVKSPEKMLDPKISVKVSIGGMRDGIFTGKSLKDYLPGDYVNARRIINGTESATKVSRYANVFESALKDAGYGNTKPVSTTGGNWLLDLIKAILSLVKK